MKFKKTIIALSTTLLSSAVFAGNTCDLSHLSAWTMNVNNGNKLSVTDAAAMAGTDCGLEVEVVSQPGGQSTKHFVQDSSPDNETRYRAAFCVDPNSVGMPSSGANRKVKIHQAQCAGGLCESGDIAQFKLQNNGSNYQLEVWVRDKNIPSWRNTNNVDIGDEPTRVEYDLNLTAKTLKVWVNATSESDTPAINLSGLDIDAWPVVTRSRLGSMDKSTRVTQGDTYYLDEFESRRQTFIGGSCN